MHGKAFLVVIFCLITAHQVQASCSGLKGKDLEECRGAEGRMLREAQKQFRESNSAAYFDRAACVGAKYSEAKKHSRLFSHPELRKSILVEALQTHQCFEGRLKNPRYLSIVDLSLHSAKKRFFVIDLQNETVTAYLTAHGRGSDPKHTGYATVFSDKAHSLMSSLGYFTTAEIYTGGHGKTLALDGKSPTNQKARSRSIVIHGASYVDPQRDKMGRSWGCPSLAPADLDAVVDKIKGGSLLAIFQ